MLVQKYHRLTNIIDSPESLLVLKRLIHQTAASSRYWRVGARVADPGGAEGQVATEAHHVDVADERSADWPHLVRDLLPCLPKAADLLRHQYSPAGAAAKAS